MLAYISKKTSLLYISPMSGLFPQVEITGLVSGQGISSRRAVRVATVTNGTFATAYADGMTVDGVVLATGDRVLLRNQTNTIENGVYVVSASGAPSRAEDFDEEDQVGGSVVFIQEGTAHAKTEWLCDNGVVGSDSLVFTRTNTRAPLATPIGGVPVWGTAYGSAIVDSGVTIIDNTIGNAAGLELIDAVAPVSVAGTGQIYKVSGSDGLWYTADGGSAVDLTTVAVRQNGTFVIDARALNFTGGLQVVNGGGSAAAVSVIGGMSTATATTTDASPTTIAMIPVALDTVSTVTATFAARRTDVPGTGAGYRYVATARNTAGVVSVVGGFERFQFEDVLAWNVDSVVSGSNVVLRVIGATGSVITWRVNYFTVIA